MRSLKNDYKEHLVAGTEAHPTGKIKVVAAVSARPRQKIARIGFVQRSQIAVTRIFSGGASTWVRPSILIIITWLRQPGISLYIRRPVPAQRTPPAPSG